MNNAFFSGKFDKSLDDKNRFGLPQQMRYGLVENGELQFTLALGLGGCLTIYRRSDIDKIAAKFQAKQHIAKYQKFLTLFFSTLHHTTCDKQGRVHIPDTLREAAGIRKQQNIAVVGVLNKIEIWPQDKYEADLQTFLKSQDDSFSSMMEEAFAFLGEEGKEREVDTPINGHEKDKDQEI